MTSEVGLIVVALGIAGWLVAIYALRRPKVRSVELQYLDQVEECAGRLARMGVCASCLAEPNSHRTSRTTATVDGAGWWTVECGGGCGRRASGARLASALDRYQYETR